MSSSETINFKSWGQSGKVEHKQHVLTLKLAQKYLERCYLKLARNESFAVSWKISMKF